jgi:hypothetical protein
MPLGLGGRNSLAPLPVRSAHRGRNDSAGNGLKSRFSLWSCVVSWDRPFDQPVPLPSGPPARTLRDAANFITKLPKAEHDSPEWRLAVHMLIEAAEDRGPMLFARMGLLRASSRDTPERVFNSSRKDTHWGKRKLKRDE